MGLLYPTKLSFAEIDGNIIHIFYYTSISKAHTMEEAFIFIFLWYQNDILMKYHNELTKIYLNNHLRYNK